MTTVCICGGGNLGHVTAAMLASRPADYSVNILTSRPADWSATVEVTLPDGNTRSGGLHRVSSNPADVVPEADILLLCLPGFLIRETLQSVRPFVKPDAAIGSVVASTGFFFEAKPIFGDSGNTLFGFQRVPFISRTLNYGSRSALLGFKKSLAVSIEQCASPDTVRTRLEDMFETPVTMLSSFYEASLTNSNPLLHPARLYSLWKDYEEGIVYPSIPLFYEDWTDFAAEVYIAMDSEFQSLLDCLPIEKGSIPTVLDYYESHDAPSLAAKLRSIEAFKGIASPMKKVAGGFVPDFANRYFTEDFPYGLAIVRRLAKEHDVAAPTIERVYSWGESWIKECKKM